ncbi:MAG: NAD(P)-dependent oxidoreductase [Candidatus Saccharimonas sp.]
MDNSNFVILGANGQLGTALRAQYPSARAVDSAELDITDQTAVENYDWTNVTHILNAAAYTDVDSAETPEGRRSAWLVNATAVANLARICTQHDITLVHISSDYVFDGTATPHLEDESLTPLGVYGQSKAAGDIVVSTLAKHYILRTTWVIGEGKNFVRTMLSLAEKGVSPTVVNDQIGRLTFTNELVRIIDHLLSSNASYGTYNATNNGMLASWADIAREVFTLSRHSNLTITGTATKEYFANKLGIAPRPLNSDMSLDKLHATGFTSHDWHDDLVDYIQKEIGS